MDEDSDIQFMGPKIDLKSSIGGEDSFIEFDFEARAIFKRLADDIYESDEAGLREPLSNSITAAKEASDKYGVENPVVEITVKKGDRLQLVLQDNGVGISRDILKNVLSVIGNTIYLDRGDLSGKYGMGFLACYKLVGTDGGFIMHTRSRKTGENISGVWKPGGFDEDTKNELGNPFVEEDQYGTRFEFYLDKKISIEDVRSWINTHAEWSRIPVIYTEIDQEGRETTEDYGVKELQEEYTGDFFTVSIENEYFEAYCSPSARSRTILLDSPIRRNYSLRKIPWPVDIRFKSENDVIIDGPHEGKIPIKKSRYEDMSASRKERYIPEDNVLQSEIRLPGPIGTRDSLDYNDDFWVYLRKELLQRLFDEAESAFLELDEHGVFRKLSKRDKLLTMKLTSEGPPDEERTSSIKNSLENYGIEITSETAKKIKYLHSECQQLVGFSHSSHHMWEWDKKVWEVIDEAGETGEIYMGVQPSDDKLEMVLEADDNNQYVNLKGVREYEKFEERFGWKQLSDVEWSSVEEYDVPAHLRNRIEQNHKVASDSEEQSVPSDNENIKIYYENEDELSSVSLNPSELVERFSSEKDGSIRGVGLEPATTLVMFPLTGDKNLTGNRQLATPRLGVASCSSEQWDVLKSVPNILHGDVFFEEAMNLELFTSNGEVTYEEISGNEKDYVFHILKKDVVHKFREPQVMRGAREFVQTEITGSRGTLRFPNATYIPISLERMDLLRPAINQRTQIIYGDESYDMGRTYSVNDARMYAYAKLPSYRGESELEVFERYYGDLSRALPLIEELHSSQS